MKFIFNFANRVSPHQVKSEPFTLGTANIVVKQEPFDEIDNLKRAPMRKARKDPKDENLTNNKGDQILFKNRPAEE